MNPSNFPRSRSGTIAAIVAIDIGIRPPAPIPWTTRHAISTGIDGAAPQSADPSRKIAIATSEDPPAPVEVAELPVERDRRDTGEQVGREDPRVDVQPAEVGDDRRRRRRDDRLVERGEDRDQHQAAVDREHAAERQLVPGRAVGRASVRETRLHGIW